ncbi:MAG: hypothetical protein ACRD2H_07675 [Terriglobales bacterium]
MLAGFAVLTALTFVSIAAARAQEVPLALAPPDHPIPQAALDRLVFHEAAALERQAENLETQGKDGSAFRRHIVHQLGLTQAQLPAFMALATEYSAEDKATISGYASTIKAWRDEYFPGGRLRADLTNPPPGPAALKQLKADRETLVEKYRKLLHSTFGDAAASQIEATIRKRVPYGLKVIDPKPVASPGGAQ